MYHRHFCYHLHHVTALTSSYMITFMVCCDALCIIVIVVIIIICIKNTSDIKGKTEDN